MAHSKFEMYLSVIQQVKHKLLEICDKDQNHIQDKSKMLNKKTNSAELMNLQKLNHAIDCYVSELESDVWDFSVLLKVDNTWRKVDSSPLSDQSYQSVERLTLFASLCVFAEYEVIQKRVIKRIAGLHNSSSQVKCETIRNFWNNTPSFIRDSLLSYVYIIDFNDSLPELHNIILDAVCSNLGLKSEKEVRNSEPWNQFHEGGGQKYAPADVSSDSMIASSGKLMNKHEALEQLRDVIMNRLIKKYHLPESIPDVENFQGLIYKYYSGEFTSIKALAVALGILKDDTSDSARERWLHRLLNGENVKKAGERAIRKLFE